MGDEEETTIGDQYLNKLNAGLKVHDAVRESVKGINEFSNIFSQSYSGLAKQMEEITRPYKSLQSIIDKTKVQSSLIESVRSANKALFDTTPNDAYDFSAPNRTLSQLLATPSPRNPVHDTNEKLQSIEEQFEKMLEVMVNAANIANDIQANAATFIDKFEAASQQTDASARNAIRVGVIAIGITIATFLIPQIINLFTIDPTVAAIEALSREVATSQQTQNGMVERFVTEFRDGDEAIVKGIAAELHANQEETNDLLRSLLKQLAEKPKESLPLPQP